MPTPTLNPLEDNSEIFAVLKTIRDEANYFYGQSSDIVDRKNYQRIYELADAGMRKIASK